MNQKPMYTPGPWQVLPEEMGKNYLRVRGTQLGLRYKIADVRHVEYDKAPESEVKMTQANARLIAAAPEMLAIIQSVMEPNADVRAVFARSQAVLERIA